MKKKMISLILVLALVLGICPAAFAVENTTALQEDIQEKMLQLLATAEPEKEMYGLAGVDFHQVSIGSEVPAYRVEDGELVSANVRLFPVLDDGEICSMFYVVQTPGEETYAQLSANLVVPIDQYTEQGDSFAILYDDEGAHIYANGILSLLGSAEGVTGGARLQSNAASILADECLQDITTSTAQTQQTLNVYEYMKSLPQPRIEQAKYLNVQIIKQPASENTCWAITSTAIINYVKKTNYSYKTIWNQFNGGANQGESITFCMSKMNQYYEMNYDPKENGPTIDKNFAFAQLTNGFPLWGAFNGPKSAHVAVIRGINLNTNAFSVMNPTASTTGYTLGTFSDGSWKFVSEHSGNTFVMYGYGYRRNGG